VKVIVLAGGLGTRLSEETDLKPKPMVLIDDKPILWHLMNSFAIQGMNEFVIALGYRGDVIKRWLYDLNVLEGNFTIDTQNRKIEHLEVGTARDWKVTALETGLESLTGRRISQCLKAFPNQRVIATYGDGLANISIKKLIEFHEDHGKLATVTAVRPPARFGHLEINGSQVMNFAEKNKNDSTWINGGYFVLEPEVIEFLSDSNEAFETGALPRLVEKQQLMAYRHHDFWQPMDTLREKNELSVLAKENPPPWLRYQ